MWLNVDVATAYIFGILALLSWSATYNHRRNRWGSPGLNFSCTKLIPFVARVTYRAFENLVFRSIGIVNAN